MAEHSVRDRALRAEDVVQPHRAAVGRVLLQCAGRHDVLVHLGIGRGAVVLRAAVCDEEARTRVARARGCAFLPAGLLAARAGRFSLAVDRRPGVYALFRTGRLLLHARSAG